jgi:hypothetical protein
MREDLHEGNAQIHHLPCPTQEQQVQGWKESLVVLMSGGILTAGDATRKTRAPALRAATGRLAPGPARQPQADPATTVPDISGWTSQRNR